MRFRLVLSTRACTSRCNLWSGREEDRADAQCSFCDTDFVGTDGEGGGKFASAGALAAHVGRLWGEGAKRRLVVVTGGEPMLHRRRLKPFIELLRARGVEHVTMETNATIWDPTLLHDVDLWSLSPKQLRMLGSAATSTDSG